MPVAELGVDRRLVSGAERKLRRYGVGVGQCLNSMLLTIVKMPGLKTFTVSNVGGLQVSFPLSFHAAGNSYIAKVMAEAEGGFSAEVPSLPGCVTDGETLEELKSNLAEAAEGWLETREEVFGDAYAYRRNRA